MSDVPQGTPNDAAPAPVRHPAAPETCRLTVYVTKDRIERIEALARDLMTKNPFASKSDAIRILLDEALDARAAASRASSA